MAIDSNFISLMTNPTLLGAILLTIIGILFLKHVSEGKRLGPEFSSPSWRKSAIIDTGQGIGEVKGGTQLGPDTWRIKYDIGGVVVSSVINREDLSERDVFNNLLGIGPPQYKVKKFVPQTSQDREMLNELNNLKRSKKKAEDDLTMSRGNVALEIEKYMEILKRLEQSRREKDTLGKNI